MERFVEREKNTLRGGAACRSGKSLSLARRSVLRGSQWKREREIESDCTCAVLLLLLELMTYKIACNM